MIDPESLDPSDCDIMVQPDGIVQIFWLDDDNVLCGLEDSLFGSPEERLLADIMLDK